MAAKITLHFAALLCPRAAFHNLPKSQNRVVSAYKCFSTTFPAYNSDSDPSLNFSPSATPSQTRNGKWLSTMKTRIGKCVFHGLKNEEMSEASAILADLAGNWREYVASSQGFLTREHRRGLFRHSVVWGDMDSMAHVNNVIFTRWAESARIVWALNYAQYIDPAHAEDWKKLWTPKGLGLILKSIKVDYKFPMEWPDKVSVYHKLSIVSSDSFTLDVMILSEKSQHPAARCMEDIVIYDYKAAGKAPVPEWMRIQFDKTLQLQKEAAEDAHEAMEGVERRVDELERKVLSRAEEK
ncbi:thioesterase-like superfamily-domain-containing protein [Tirmania nivea]|nr:thioesterase-like superfamily-domain-containing protein [Tirmania nivea]